MNGGLICESASSPSDPTEGGREGGATTPEKSLPLPPNTTFFSCDRRGSLHNLNIREKMEEEKR